MWYNAGFTIPGIFVDEYLDGVPVCSMGKPEIEETVQRFIEINLENIDSGTLYLYLKQLEYAVKTGIENLKDQAFDSLGEKLGGLSSGKVLGHDVAISYPHEWHYSPAVDILKDKHKVELERLQDEEKTQNIAQRVQGKGRVTITLRNG